MILSIKKSTTLNVYISKKIKTLFRSSKIGVSRDKYALFNIILVSKYENKVDAIKNVIVFIYDKVMNYSDVEAHILKVYNFNV